MKTLAELPNLGENLTRKLNFIGINNAEDLMNVGSKRAFLMLSHIDSGVCLNMLYALEGAVQEMRWHYLSSEEKQNLKEYFGLVKSMNEELIA